MTDKPSHMCQSGFCYLDRGHGGLHELDARIGPGSNWGLPVAAVSPPPTEDPRTESDAAKLRTLADWFDAKYPDDANPEVQRDFRRIARDLDEIAALRRPVGDSNPDPAAAHEEWLKTGQCPTCLASNPAVTALREAADAMDAETYATIPDDWAEWLRARADALAGSVSTEQPESGTP